MIDEQLDFFNNLDKNFIALFIEDNEETRKNTTLLLKNLIPNIESAKDGIEGLEIFNNHKHSKDKRDFDLIITDIEMPRKDGLSMLSEIKTISPNLPIVIISAYDNSEYFLEAINVGINNYILKPYTIEKLTNILYTSLQTYVKKTDSIETKLDKNIMINIGLDYLYDNFNKTLYYQNKFIKISKKENDLIEILLKFKGNSVSYKTVEHYIWGDSVNTHSLKSLVYRLRLKLDNDIVETTSNFGYKLKYYKKEI